MRGFAKVVMGLALVGVAEGREPTNIEQYYLELVNRARANPTGEIGWISSNVPGKSWDGTPGLNEGLPVGTISSAPKQPLAFNVDLMAAASNYADLLLANESISHTYSGTPDSRAAAQGYDGLVGENLSLSSKTGGVPPLDAELARNQHADLFIDSGVAGRGHRVSLLNDSYHEIGLALRLDVDGQSYFGLPFNGDAMTAQEFGIPEPGAGIYVTGVAFSDRVGGTANFYDVGEGIAGLTLEVLDAPGGTVVAEIAAFASGGFSLDTTTEAVAAGTFYARLRNAAGDVSQEVSFTFTGSRNVKVDFANPTFSAPPPTGEVGSGTPYDFNNDGTADLVWHNPVTGASWSQFIRDQTPVGGKTFDVAVGAPWEQHTDDLNGDGHPDLLFRNPNTGVMWVRFLRDGLSVGGRALSVAVGRPWTLQLGDFNADGNPDLLWQNTVTGVLWIQFLDASLAPNGGKVVPLTLTYPWRISPWPMNGDGHADLVLRNAVTGTTWISYLRNGSTIGGRILPDAIGAPWYVRVADENGDSHPDLLWHNPVTGVMWTRLLNESATTIGGVVSPVAISSPWRLVGAK